MSNIDVTVIEDMQASDSAMAAKFVDLVLNDLSMRLQILQSAVQNLDYAEIRTVSHAMKPVAAQIGAKEFSQICAYLEKVQDDQSLEDMVNILIKQFEEMKPILESYR